MGRDLRLAGTVAAGLLLVAAVASWARQPPARSSAQPQVQSQAGTETAESMGVSLKSIRRQLKDMPAPRQASGTGLRYDFFVDVLGKRPPVDFFKDFDLATKGGVRWGGVTHQEILDAVTPMPFRMHTGGVNLLDFTRKKK